LDNLIVDKNGAVWIVDWENAMLGDPLFDVAQFGASYGNNGYLKRLADGYGVNVDISSLRYFLYEIIMLIGIIDFCYKYKVDFGEKLIRLKRQIGELFVH